MPYPSRAFCERVGLFYSGLTPTLGTIPIRLVAHPFAWNGPIVPYPFARSPARRVGQFDP